MENKYDHLGGDEKRQELARRRHEAILNGTLPEFEAELEAEKEKNQSGIPTHIIPESIEDRKELTHKGKPEAPFLRDALQYKLRNPGDSRSIQEIAQALMRGEELDQAA